MYDNCTTKVNVNETLNTLSHGIHRHMWQVNGLLLLNAILMGVVVGVGAYAPRYRRHPVVGVLFLGATTLFLPIISSVAATVGSVRGLIDSLLRSLNSQLSCSQFRHLVLVFLWTGLVVVIGINASAVVAGDAREGRNLEPPIELLVKAFWIAYLTVSNVRYVLESDVFIILGQLFLIMFTKLLFKYYAFFMARRSFALGRNPRLIAGYMAQLRQLDESNSTPTDQQQVDDEHAVPPSPPALVVMGEDNVQVKKQPHGYTFKTIPDQSDTTRIKYTSNGLVTLDKVWRLDKMDMIQRSAARPKDLCFSFALFKLLRCRFAKYRLSEAGFVKVHKFFRETLLQGDDYERIFQVIADELSFINDYYYSSLPIYYSNQLLPIFSITLSLYSIGYCLFLIVLFIGEFARSGLGQINCFARCGNVGSYDFGYMLQFGAILFDVVPLYLVLVVLVLSETRDIVYYICSNWTKVALIYHNINQASWQRSPVMQKCIGLVLKYCRCKLVNSWNNKMKQCSILEPLPHSKKILLPIRHLLHLRDFKKKTEIPNAVKAAIFDALKGEGLTCEHEGTLRHIRPPSPPISSSTAADIGGNTALYACDGKRPAYTILAWHIATTIFEARHPQPSVPGRHKIAATHLSRYCAYLVTYCPELLPDDDEWCKSLYDDVKKDAGRVLSKGAGEEHQHRDLVRLLSAESKHEVLKDGATLGTQLVNSKTGWEALARFWSEMILYVAPSENLEGHAEAIASGGELISLLWTLLAHAGIVGRLDADAAATAGDAGRV